MRVLACALLVATAFGCSRKVELFCDENTPCEDPELPFCDLTGEFPASEGIGRTCIPDPFAGDAGLPCESGLTNCSGTCLDTKIDRDNCGGCGPTFACAVTEGCVDSRCAPLCGNDVQDDGEECDDGASNSDAVPDACRTNCLNPFCGDGTTDSGEECDVANDNNGDDCIGEDCVFNTCGDGFLHGGVEECDSGPGNSDTLPDACRTDCSLAHCGDGVQDSADVCDDGNTDPCGTCSATCGAVQAGGDCGTGIGCVTPADCASGVCTNQLCE